MQKNLVALELESAVESIVSWDSAAKLLKSKNIPLDRDCIKNLNQILEEGVEQTDELIDRIPYMFVIQNDNIRIRIKLGKWVTLTRKTVAKLALLP